MYPGNRAVYCRVQVVKSDEYEIMFRVEDHHWWYVGLRALLDLYWQRHVRSDRPRILDVGCGTGATLDALRDVADATGIDAAIEAVRLCRMRELGATTVASAACLPFPEEQFDAIISCDVLCHRSIQDKAVPLQEMWRVLKPGGLLLLNLPAYQWLHSSHDVHVYTDKRFTRAETEALLSSSRFEVIEATYWNTILFPAIALVRLWRKAFPLSASDLDEEHPSAMSPVFGACLALERALLRRMTFPFGLSVFILARKRSS